MSETIKLAQELIACPSVTPNDAGCQNLLKSRLNDLGFISTDLKYGDVTNFWASRGSSKPIFVFAGHTDVVPTGPLDSWQTNPFTPTIKNDFLFGRGAADMKGSLAAMITACEGFIEKYPNHNGTIGFLITSDEEGPAINGTCKVVDYLKNKNIIPDWCIVGEPSSEKQLGDTIKIGRRGSLSGKLTITGKQGHIAYPQLAENPIHRAIPILDELLQIHWDHGNQHFPPTSLQISNINGGTGATNVIPETIQIDFNLRFSPEVTADKIQQKIDSLLKKFPIHFSLEWNLSALPFLTNSKTLINATSECIQSISGIVPTLATTGGTSDGRFIAPLGTEIVELGPCNATIHQINENVSVKDLDQLSKIYEAILIKLLAN